MRRLIDTALAQAQVTPALPGVPRGVQTAVREGNGELLLILLNHNAEPRTVALPAPMRVEVGSQHGAVADAVFLAPLDVAVLRQTEGVIR